jgi:adenylyltransferase/sulfurtransferase
LEDRILVEEITVTDLKRLLDSAIDVQLIDVRQPNEWAFAKIEGAKLIPLGEILQRMEELDADREAIIYCRSGVRSERAVMALKQAGYPGVLKNLRGGITAWSNEIDPSLPLY